VARDCLGRLCDHGTCRCIDFAPPDLGGVDAGPPSGTYVARAHVDQQHPDQSFLDVLKTDKSSGVCLHVKIINGGPYPTPILARVPCGWEMVPAERYGAGWDCSITFQEGIPGGGVTSGVTGDVVFTVKQGQIAPCTMSMHGNVSFAGIMPPGEYPFDFENIPVTDGCQ
jgi:hypothetical protein